eukprot:TRINITY_DN1219_c0_g1_i1.p1 TRINITY_DN1219_c0_g1~~TRINITY_DN1219_c0_g1_i1.p1  ORF type:complete len:281 (+),score=54.18 TRINITY_DN1219_c0_g1_i1:29-844(+)
MASPPSTAPTYKTLDQLVGNTPLVKLSKLEGSQENGNLILAKLEGFNPTCSVKARAAFNMIIQAQARGEIKPGDTIIEATSGNTGIALCAAAAILGYEMVVVMSDSATEERKQSMTAYGAECVLVPASGGGVVLARNTALKMQEDGKGTVLDQFNNDDNWKAHYDSTGPEIWTDTAGTVTHFVSAMGTTGTIMGAGRYLKEQNSDIQVVGVHPEPGSKIPGSYSCSLTHSLTHSLTCSLTKYTSTPCFIPTSLFYSSSSATITAPLLSFAR